MKADFIYIVLYVFRLFYSLLAALDLKMKSV